MGRICDVGSATISRGERVKLNRQAAIEDREQSTAVGYITFFNLPRPATATATATATTTTTATA